ncbi:MAG: hypothetical protein CSA95_01500 [Bacteroidetes bacterium]|nr:MAG: hypothetical protein CSA95_01500 [Bacteroidota bacterium]
MDRKIVQQVIRETLEAVNDQVKMITEQKGKVPWIEIDITKDYLRTLYENILVLERYNGVEQEEQEALSQEAAPGLVDEGETISFGEVKDPPTEVLVTATEEEMGVETVREEAKREPEVSEEKEEHVVVSPEPEPEGAKAEELPEEKPVVTRETVAVREEVELPLETEETPKPEKEDLFSLPEQEERPAPKEASPAPEEAVAVTPPADREDLPSEAEEGHVTTLADKLKTDTKSLGETILNGEKTLGEDMGKKPIGTLKSAIGINDKFRFVNELFDGVLKSYNEAITVLDGASDLQDARSILDRQKEKYAWDPGNEAFGTLKDFVERKFTL